MNELLVLLTVAMNTIGAGINLAMAIINARSKKNPYPQQSDKDSE